MSAGRIKADARFAVNGAAAGVVVVVVVSRRVRVQAENYYYRIILSRLSIEEIISMLEKMK